MMCSSVFLFGFFQRVDNSFQTVNFCLVIYDDFLQVLDFLFKYCNFIPQGFMTSINDFVFLSLFCCFEFFDYGLIFLNGFSVCGDIFVTLFDFSFDTFLVLCQRTIID